MIQEWTCPSSEQWEKYILDPEMKEQIELKIHLEKCPKCRFVVEQYRNNFEKLQRVWNESANSKIYYLTEHNINLDYQGRSSTLLAAQGEEESEINSVTFSSPKQEVFLRVIRNSISQDIWLYIMADEPSLFTNVLVKPFGRDEEYLTDDKGRVNLGKTKWPGSDELMAEVKLPQATFSLKPFEDLTDKDNSIELKSPTGDRIKVTISEEGRNRKLTVQILNISETALQKDMRVVVRGTGIVKILPLKQNITDKVIISSDDSLGELEIYLY